MGSSAHMQLILHQLHRQLAAASQPPPHASASTPMPLPAPWHPTADLIRQMRAAATSMYEQVLDESERDKAREWGWSPTPAAAVAAAASTTAVQSPQAGASALSLQSAASFHRFSVPLAPLLDNFLAASSSVRSIVSYHTALIACLQAATRTPAGMAAAGAVAAGSPSAQQLQQLSRTFLFTLKQRVELQRQVARVQGNFARAQHAIQQELQQRKRRQQIQGESVALAAVPADAAEVSLPPCDLFSITASLGLLRAQLSLVKSNDDPAAAYSIQPPGSTEICSDKTSDGRDVATLALEDAEDSDAQNGAITPISTKALACEKHIVNLSSTGTEECFVYDICLIKPLLRSDEDRAVVLQLLREVAALPRGIDSLHPQSSLSQMLRHGFCIHGKLEALSGSEHAMDAEEIRLVYLHDFDAYASKIAFRVELERLCDAHPDLKLFTKQADVLAVMQTMEKDEVPPSADVKSQPQLLGRMSVHTKVEGPCMTFRDRLARGAPSALVAASKRNELAITCVGVEKVYAFNQQADGAQAMDTSSSSAAAAAPASSSPFTFAYRFILSHPLLLTFKDASLLFGWPAAASSTAAISSTPSSSGSDSPIREGSFYQLCRNHSVPFLLDPTQGKNVYCNVLGSKQEYVVVMEPTEAGAKATLQEPALLLSSFLCRSLEQLPVQLRRCRDLFLYQRLYRSIFEPIDSHFHIAPSSAQPAAVVQSAPSSAAAPAAPAPAAPAAARPAKLKFSYRQFISEESNSGAPPQQQRDVGLQPRSGNAATSLQLQAAASSSVALHCKHPLTGANLEVRVQFADSSTPSVTIRCADGHVPSSAFASALLHSTASLPVLLHSLLERCKRGKRSA